MKAFRGQLLIHRRFQLYLIGYLVLVAGFIGATFYVANVKLYNGMAERMIALGFGENAELMELIDVRRTLMSQVHLLLGIGSTIIIIVTGLLITHRVAGPVYRLMQVLQDPAKLEHDIKFRKDDFFREVAEAVNQRNPKIAGFKVRTGKKPDDHGNS